MYTLENLNNARDIKLYVTQAMREKKLAPSEIQDYLQQAQKSDFNNLFQVSKEFIQMLNDMEKQQEVKVSYIQDLGRTTPVTINTVKGNTTSKTTKIEPKVEKQKKVKEKQTIKEKIIQEVKQDVKQENQFKLQQTPFEFKPIDINPVEIKPIEIKPIEIKFVFEVKPIEIKFVVEQRVGNETQSTQSTQTIKPSGANIKDISTTDKKELLFTLDNEQYKIVKYKGQKVAIEANYNGFWQEIKNQKRIMLKALEDMFGVERDPAWDTYTAGRRLFKYLKEATNENR